MNFKITHFNSPFSFYLTTNTANSGAEINDYSSSQMFLKKQWSDVNHGQYVAVWHQNKWTRGIISMESHVLIWLVDSGCYLRPDDSTLYVDLPAEFKKLPTKVFEGSIHGVVPIDKVMSEECEIKDVVSTTWNQGAIEKGQNTIKSSRAIYFVPIGLMCTKGNDIVLGDLYLDIPGQGIVNFIDIMEVWPVFLQRDPKGYIENLSTFYSSRRKHHACLLKPVITDELPRMSTITSLPLYQKHVSNAPKLEIEDESCSEDGTVITKPYNSHLTAEELEEYSQMYIKINGTQHNVLNIIINKCRDLSLCERYKNRTSAGRATSRRSVFESQIRLSSFAEIEDSDFD